MREIQLITAKLMLVAVRFAGARTVTLDSSLNAHEFYKHHGFQDTGPLKWSEIGGFQVRGYPMALNLGDRQGLKI